MSSVWGKEKDSTLAYLASRFGCIGPLDSELLIKSAKQAIPQKDEKFEDINQKLASVACLTSLYRDGVENSNSRNIPNEILKEKPEFFQFIIQHLKFISTLKEFESEALAKLMAELLMLLFWMASFQKFTALQSFKFISNLSQVIFLNSEMLKSVAFEGKDGAHSFLKIRLLTVFVILEVLDLHNLLKMDRIIIIQEKATLVESPDIIMKLDSEVFHLLPNDPVCAILDLAWASYLARIIDLIPEKSKEWALFLKYIESKCHPAELHRLYAQKAFSNNPWPIFHQMALPLSTPSRNRLLSFTRPQDRKWLLRTLLATVTLFASSFDLNHVPSAHFIIDFAAQAFANHSKIFTFAMIMNTNNANLELMMTRNDFEMFRKIWLNPVLLQLPAPAKSALAFYTGLLTLKSFEHTALMMEHFHFTNFIQQDVDPDLVEHIEKGQVKALYTFSAGCDIHSKSLVIPRGMIGQIISFDENTQIMWPLQFSIWDFALDVLEGHLNTANSIDLLDACIVFLTSLFESFGLFSHNWRTHWIDMNQVRCLGDLVSRLFDKFASLPNPPPLIIEHSIKFLQSFITVFPMDIGLCLKQANLISSVCERSFHSPVSHLYHLQQTIEIKKDSITIAFIKLVETCFLQTSYFVLNSISNQMNHLDIIRSLFDYITLEMMTSLDSWRFQSLEDRMDVISALIDLFVSVLKETAPVMASLSENEETHNSFLGRVGQLILSVLQNLVFDSNANRITFLLSHIAIPKTTPKIASIMLENQTVEIVAKSLDLLERILVFQALIKLDGKVLHSVLTDTNARDSKSIIQIISNYVSVTTHKTIAISSARIICLCMRNGAGFFTSSFLELVGSRLKQEFPVDLKLPLLLSLRTAILNYPNPAAMILGINQESNSILDIVLELMNKSLELYQTEPSVLSYLIIFLEAVLIKRTAFPSVFEKIISKNDLWVSLIKLMEENPNPNIEDARSIVTQSHQKTIMARIFDIFYVLLLRIPTSPAELPPHLLSLRKLLTMPDAMIKCIKKFSQVSYNHLLNSLATDVKQRYNIELELLKRVSWANETDKCVLFGSSYIYSVSLSAPFKELVGPLESANLAWTCFDAQAIRFHSWTRLMTVLLRKNLLSTENDPLWLTDSIDQVITRLSTIEWDHYVICSMASDLARNLLHLLDFWFRSTSLASLPDVWIKNLESVCCIIEKNQNTNSLQRIILTKRDDAFDFVLSLLSSIVIMGSSLAKSYANKNSLNEKLLLCTTEKVFRIALSLVSGTFANSTSFYHVGPLLFGMISNCLHIPAFASGSLCTQLMERYEFVPTVLRLLSSDKIGTDAHHSLSLALFDILVLLSKSKNTLHNLVQYQVFDILEQAPFFKMILSGKMLVPVGKPDIVYPLWKSVISLMQNMVHVAGDEETTLFCVLRAISSFSLPIARVLSLPISETDVSLTSIEELELVLGLFCSISMHYDIWRRRQEPIASQFIESALPLIRRISDLLLYPNRSHGIFRQSKTGNRHWTELEPNECQERLAPILRNLFISFKTFSNADDPFHLACSEWRTPASLFAPVLQSSGPDGITSLGVLSHLLGFIRDCILSNACKESTKVCWTQVAEIGFVIFVSQLAFHIQSPSMNPHQKEQFGMEIGEELCMLLESHSKALDRSTSFRPSVRFTNGLLKFTWNTVLSSYN